MKMSYRRPIGKNTSNKVASDSLMVEKVTLNIQNVFIFYFDVW